MNMFRRRGNIDVFQLSAANKLIAGHDNASVVLSVLINKWFIRWLIDVRWLSRNKQDKMRHEERYQNFDKTQSQQYVLRQKNSVQEYTDIIVIYIKSRWMTVL